MSMIQYYSLLSTTVNYVYDHQGGSASPELEDTLSSPRRGPSVPLVLAVLTLEFHPCRLIGKKQMIYWDLTGKHGDFTGV